MPHQTHARLSVNLNKVALLRNARHADVPNVLEFADLALEAGSSGITLHPRPDERHVRKSDVTLIAKRMRPLRPHKELNIEGYPDPEWLRLVSIVKPEQCTLVPDAASAFTSEEGWELSEKHMSVLQKAIKKLRAFKTRVILFVSPGFSSFEKIHNLRADGIEIYTGEYARLFKTGEHETELKKITKTAQRAHKLGLRVHIGHDLNLKNLPLLIKEVGSFVSEASIGHELTADALKYGFSETVRRYTKALGGSEKTTNEAPEKNPFRQFEHWYAETKTETQPNAMTLATTTKEGHPSARIVFLRDHNTKGFTFFTNYQSRKSKELTENPNAAILFHWNVSGRQIRITGHVSRTPKKESETYFDTRPRESQLSAWASEQSAVLANTESLERRMTALRKKFDGKKIPLPPHWGGFRITPSEFEFWAQGNSGRLHTRLVYIKKGASWKRAWLAP